MKRKQESSCENILNLKVSMEKPYNFLKSIHFILLYASINLKQVRLKVILFQ